MRGSREWRGFRCCTGLVCLSACLCLWSSENVRRLEIARLVRVGSTPGGTEKEQREHLPPSLQDQFFRPWRQGDAGMVGATKEGEVAGKAALSCFSLSPVHLYRLFKLSPTQSLYPMGSETGVDFFFCLVMFWKMPAFRMINTNVGIYFQILTFVLQVCVMTLKITL